VNKSLRQRSERQDKEDRIAAVIQSSGFVMHYQPILRLADMQLAGLESLCRFSADPPRSPDLWFGEAAELGLGVELELAAIAAALAALPTLPPDCYLSVNAGPATVADGRLGAVLTGRDGHRLVVEVTEHAAVTDQARFDAELFKLRMMGVRLAVDDAGAGYSGLQHIVRLQPDIIKLDMSLTRHVDRDPIRRSLAAALVAFGRETGAAIVAEGIETQAEAETMRQIGIRFGQGYLFARPMPLEAVHGTILAQPHVA
jgi:EAL domain-containing protein (putative c-di-GMP-specific phosphodiesterase class I)